MMQRWSKQMSDERLSRLVRQRLGATVRTLRQQRAVALNAVAIESGLSAAQLTRIERCLLVPSYDALVRLSYALDIDLAKWVAAESAFDLVEVELDAICNCLRLSISARTDLKRLSTSTHAELQSGWREAQQRF